MVKPVICNYGRCDHSQYQQAIQKELAARWSALLFVFVFSPAYHFSSFNPGAAG